MANISTSLLVISIFKNVINDEVVSSFINFVSQLENNKNFDELIKLYTDFTSLLYEKELNQNLYNYLKFLIYTDENIISKGCGNCIKENEQIINSADYEIKLLDKLFLYDYSYIRSHLLSKFPDMKDIIEHIPIFYVDGKEDFNIYNIINSYSKNGYGIFSCYSAFKYDENGNIIPVKYIDNITFNDLKNYEYQKNIIKQNTTAFIEGKEANNILLYGDRGCGKSSTVRALLNEFADYNLKIIQVYKESFIKLSDLFDKLRNLPLKFIIFADDISFDEEDKNFSSIKAVLEGSLSTKPKNVIIYATTNRMHLVKETFSAREGNEVHYNDTMDELASLSDRFGIMLTFSLLTKDEYLDIVYKIAQDCCVAVNEDLTQKALSFAMLKGIRTPRVARQFINDYIAKINL